jgi:hypothetical protein
MRLLTLLFLPICLWSQQIDVQWNWQGTEQIHVGDLLKRVPKAIGHTVFYDEEHQRFAISISKQLGDNPNIQYAVENIQTQEIQSDLEVDFDLNLLAARSHTMLYKTKGRNVHQVVVQIAPFIVKNNKLHAVTGFSLVPHAVKQSVAQRVQRLASISSMPPQSGFRFEVSQTGIHKIPAAFLRDLGMPISSIDPETLKIFGRGGKMLSLINSGTGGVNYGFSENPLQLVGMDDGSIDDEDYILFYAYGSTEWNEDSQTALNIYHDQAHYIISYGGENGLRVNPQSSTADIDNPQTSASVSLHIEEDLVNIAQMGRKWFGDRFLHNSSINYPFQLTNRKAATVVAVKLAAAASAANASRFDLSVENENTTLNIAPTQTLTRAAEGTTTLSSTPSSNAVDVVLHYDASGFSSAGWLFGLYPPDL